VNLGLFLLSAKAYATVESSEYPPLGAAYEKELMPIDGEVNRKVLYVKEPDQGLGNADFLTRGRLAVSKTFGRVQISLLLPNKASRATIFRGVRGKEGES
jgi:hypothetical protein